MKSNSKFRILTSAVSIGLVAFLLYALTGARTIQWQDSAQFTYRICSGELWNEYGLAMVHPLHFWLGRFILTVFPGPDPWAISLTSALGGALAVGLVFACVHALTGKRSAALFGAVTLMLAHSFWRFSGLPEVYTWSAALLLGEVWLYLGLRSGGVGDGKRWWGIFFVNGLALANHNMALLSTAVWGIAFLLWAGERGRESGDGGRGTGDGGRGSAVAWESLKPFGHLLPIACFWFLGALPYLLIVFLELKERAFGEVLHSALFGEGFKDQVTGLFPQPGYLLISLGFMLLSFPGPALPFALRACASGAGDRRRRSGDGGQETGDGGIMANMRCADTHDLAKKGLIPIVCIVVLHLLFFLRYNVIDQYTFLIPVYGLIALMAGAGFSRVKKNLWRRLAWGCLWIQPFLYAAVPALVWQSDVLKAYERHKPYRDDYAYLFLPWQVQERSAEKLMADAFDALQPGGVMVVEDAMAMYTVRWSRRQLGLEDQVRILRPAELVEGPAPAGSVWIPARADLPPLDGWRKVGEVWVARSPRTPLRGNETQALR
ncbi:DUF2723 domain-containing protein [Kiritimatiellaeota bacterium B1221]|nr:DUF2723 domain-containing protein [Kiritimatiellaeota bacterium B1221]